MNKWVIVLIAALAAQPCFALAPQTAKAPTALQSFDQCQVRYGKATFVVDGKDNVRDIADAAKNGPCVGGVGNNPSIFVPKIDKKTGVVTMQEFPANDAQVREAAVTFRRDLAMFKRVQPKEARAKLQEAMESAKQWNGPARFVAAPKQPVVAAPISAQPEVFGSPLRGPVTARYGEPLPPAEARLQRAPKARYYYDQYGRAIPVNPLREEGPYAVAAVPARAIGQGAYNVRQAGHDLTTDAGDNLNHLGRYGIAAPVVGLFSLIEGAAGVTTQVVGGVVEIPTHIVGHGVPDAFDSDKRAAERAYWQRQNGNY